VDVGGRVPAANADITSPLLWSICDQPKPPTESNSVSAACLDQDALPGTAGDSPTTYSAPAPSDSCTLFGPSIPLTPAGQPPIRPRDPDVTGGYYLPVRLGLSVPKELRRVGMATEDSIVAFQLQRIYCGLANAKEPGHLHVRKGLQAQPEPGDRLVDPAAARLRSGRGASNLGWGRAVPGCKRADCFADGFLARRLGGELPALDVLQHVLVYHNEAMRVSWYATAGSFEHDITGRSEFDNETFADNTWKPADPGVVHLWIVLHDSRGGTDFAGYDLDVTP